jgi:hypothetical protein
VLISHDFKTTPGHFYRFVSIAILESRNSPRVILIPQAPTTGQAVDELRIAWICNDAEELKTGSSTCRCDSWRESPFAAPNCRIAFMNTRW